MTPEAARHAAPALAHQQYLYRLFAKDGELIYVGTTYSPHSRLYAHSKRTWWNRVFDVRLELLEARTRTEVDTLARRRELAAIRLEQPTENVAGR